MPFAVLEPINKELMQLENLDIRSKVEYLDWTSLTVYAKKKTHKICVCMNFLTRLNNCLKPHTYPLPSPEDIFAKLNVRKVFSKLDLSDAYLQVQDNEEC